MKLTIFKGRESSLVVEDVISAIKNNGFLADSYSKAFRALRNYVECSARIREELLQGTLPRVRNSILYRSPQNIIAFSGKRGSGKSSTMLSFSEMLSNSEDVGRLCAYYRNDDTNKTRPASEGKLEDKYFVVLDPIDPTALEKNQSILSVVLSRLLFKAEEEWSRHISFYGGFQDKESRKTELLTAARQCLNGIYTIKSQKEVPQELSELQKVGDSSILKQNLFDFVELFLQFSDVEKRTSSGNGILVLQIDDTDCQISQGYEVMEDIRKYLTIPNVLILMATDTKLLRQVLLQHYVSDFSFNLKEKLIKEEELRQLSEKHLAKLMPPFRVVYLPSIDDTIRNRLDLLNLYYYEDERKEENLLNPKGNQSYEEYDFQSVILRFIYKKTHIVFASHDAYINNIIPTTLRGLSYLLSLLSSMENVPEIEFDRTPFNTDYLMKTLQAQLPILERNLNLFEEYFLHDWIPAKLPQDMSEILERFSNQVSDQRIPFITKAMRIYYGKKDATFSKTLRDVLSNWVWQSEYDFTYTYMELDELLRTIQGTTESSKGNGFRQMEDFYFVFAVRTLLTIKNNKDILKVKRQTVDNPNKSNDILLVFDYLNRKTSLPSGFYLDPVRLYGHQLVGKEIKNNDYLDSEYFQTQEDKKYFQTAYFHDNETDRYFSFTGGVIQWLAPQKEDYIDLDQLKIYKAQELAVLMAANCDVQEVARKAIARTAKNQLENEEFGFKQAVELGLTLIQNAIAGINQGMFSDYKAEQKEPIWRIEKRFGDWLEHFEHFPNSLAERAEKQKYPKFDDRVPDVFNESFIEDFRMSLTEYKEKLEKYAKSKGKVWDEKLLPSLDRFIGFEFTCESGSDITNKDEFNVLREQLYKELDAFFQDNGEE